MTVVFRIVLIIISVLTFCNIVRRVRNSKIKIEDSLFWIVFSFLLLLLSIFPGIAGWAAGILGIQSQTNFVFIFVIFVLLMKQFNDAVKMSQLEDRIRELIQDLAVKELWEEEKKEEN